MVQAAGRRHGFELLQKQRRRGCRARRAAGLSVPQKGEAIPALTITYPPKDRIADGIGILCSLIRQLSAAHKDEVH